MGHTIPVLGAVTPLDAAATGNSYVATEGEVVIQQQDGGRHSLRPGDGIFVPAGEAWGLNESGAATTMIVITPLV